MDGLEFFLSQIAGHGAFLLLVLPVIGAVLVVLSAPWGREIVLRTALTNVVFSIALSVLMLVSFDPPVVEPKGRDNTPRFQMASSSRLELAADDEPGTQSLLRVDVGVDGISLWFVVLMPLVTLAAVVHARHERQLAALLSLILLMQAALTGLFAALNVVMFVTCLEVAGLLLFVLIGRWGGPDHRRDVVPLVVFQLAGSLLVCFGLVTIVVAHAWFRGMVLREGSDPGGLTFSLVTLTGDLSLLGGRGTSEAIAIEWDSTEALVFWSLLPGFAIKSALFPFHRGFCLPGAAWPACVGVFAYGVLPCVGVYGWLRIVAPICGPSIAVYGPPLALLVLLGSVYCGLLALAQSELKRTVAYASVAHVGLAFASALTHSAAGVSAAVLHLIGHVAGFSLLVAVVAAIERRYDTLEIRAFGGLGGRLPWVAVAFFVAAFSLCGLPGLCGFPAVWQSVVAFVGLKGPDELSLREAATALIVVGLLSWTLLATGQRMFWGTRREPLPEFPFFNAELIALSTPQRPDIRDWETPERVTAALLFAVLLGVGLAPQFVADRVDSAIRPVVERGTGVADRPTAFGWPGLDRREAHQHQVSSSKWRISNPEHGISNDEGAALFTLNPPSYFCFRHSVFAIRYSSRSSHAAGVRKPRRIGEGRPL